MSKMAVIDINLGNIGSIVNMYKYLDVPVDIVTSPLELENYAKAILPGVGHFKTGISRLVETRFDKAIHKFLNTGTKYLLGICLGMQMLFEYSEEGKISGLEILKGKCVRFPDNKSLPVPHMGWNTINVDDNFLLFDKRESSHKRKFYFAHSYYVEGIDSSVDVSNAFYGVKFPAIVRENNVIGVQFHPEKSHKYGLSFLKMFSDF